MQRDTQHWKRTNDRSMQQHGWMVQVMLSERSQTHKNTYFMILFIGSAKIDKTSLYRWKSGNGYLWGTIRRVLCRGVGGVMARILLMDLSLCKKPSTGTLKMGGLSVCPLDLNCSQNTKLEIRRGFLVCLLWTGRQPGCGGSLRRGRWGTCPGCVQLSRKQASLRQRGVLRAGLLRGGQCFEEPLFWEVIKETGW